ncbi:MAG: glycosyltransferase family 4 protein [Sphingomicrobium sp.]
MTRPVDQPARKFRICVVGLRGIPGVMGGVEKHCEELLPRILARAPELAIEVVARRPYVEPGEAEFKGVKVTPLYAPRRQSSEAIVSTLVGILHAARTGADLVHIHAIGPALLAPVAKLFGMRVVFTHHGSDYDRAKWSGFAKAMLRLGERIGIACADATVVVAPSLAEQLKAKFPSRSGRINYIPNGRPEFSGAGNANDLLGRLGVRAGDYVLGVGRLVPEKNFDALIAAHKAANSGRKLVIAGGADHESRYSRGLLEQASDDVIFAGVQPRDALEQLYRNCALFILPSSHEGLPITALEAGSLGCAMLLSDIQPNKDVGLPERNYFPVGDVRALADCLSAAPESFAADAAHFDRFSWDRVADETLAVYKSVLASAPR